MQINCKKFMRSLLFSRSCCAVERRSSLDNVWDKRVLALIHIFVLAHQSSSWLPHSCSSIIFCSAVAISCRVTVPASDVSAPHLPSTPVAGGPSDLSPQPCGFFSSFFAISSACPTPSPSSVSRRSGLHLEPVGFTNSLASGDHKKHPTRLLLFVFPFLFFLCMRNERAPSETTVDRTPRLDKKRVTLSQCNAELRPKKC